MTNLKIVSSLLLICFTTLEPVIGEEANTTTTKPGVQFSARLESLFTSLKHTEYQHTTEIDEADGSVKCDCSGLVGFVLRQTYPEAYVSLRGVEAPWRTRPLAVTFYETFVSAEVKPDGCWKRVKKITDALPGDVLAWRKIKLEAGSTTGHVCTIADQPEPFGEGMVRVRLIDSTRSPHENDSRGEGENGMGSGYKTFLVDDDGQCVGYLRGKSRVTSMIAIGRLVQPTAKTSHADDSDYIGMTIDAAIELAKQRKRSCRIIRQDGKLHPIRMSIKDDRLNFVIENNQVIRVLRG